MGKGKKLGGFGIGLALSTIAGIFFVKKKKAILSMAQKNFVSFLAALKPLSSHITEQNKREVT